MIMGKKQHHGNLPCDYIQLLTSLAFSNDLGFPSRRLPLLVPIRVPNKNATDSTDLMNLTDDTLTWGELVPKLRSGAGRSSFLRPNT
jgi:hypothetical protein